MKRLVPLVLLSAVLAGPAFAAPETFVIDTNHTKPRFEYNHFGYSTQVSRFDTVSGKVVYDAAAKTGSVDVTIDAKSVNTGYALFNEHIQGEDFLDTAKHPTITFKSTAVKFKGDKPVSVTGDLTIKGVTRPVELDVTVLGFYRSMKGARRVGFSGSTTINREDWGLTWNVALEAGGWLVGKEIRIDFEVAAEEQAGEASQAA